MLLHTTRFPTNRGMFENSIGNDNLKRCIMKYGSYKPDIDFPLNDSKRKFSKLIDVKPKNDTLIPKQRLCYFIFLYIVFCETCWLFADRNSGSFKQD